MIVLIRKEQEPMDLVPLQDQARCRLLSLPAELRNQIWNLILVQNTRSSSHLQNTPEPWKKENRFCANILRTCKQVNAEGTPILYGENVFLAHPNLLSSLPALLLITHPYRVKLPPVTSPRVAKFIRRYFIYVRLDTDPRYSERQVQESFTGVEELEIEVFQSMFGSSDFTVLKLFEGVRGVGKVKIVGSLGDGRYAEWLQHTIQLAPGTKVVPYHEAFIGGSRGWAAWVSGER